MAATNPIKRKDWEDEYRRLYAKHEQLKIDFNEKEQHNKLLQTKIRKLEYDLSVLERQLGVQKSSAGAISRDKRDMVEVLSDQVANLKVFITSQNGKVGHLTEELEKKKKEIAHLKKTAALRKASQNAARPEKAVELEVVPGRASRTVSPEPAIKFPLVVTEDLNLAELAKSLKFQNFSLEKEIFDLRRRLGNASLPPLPIKSNSNHNVTELEAQLRDTTWRLQQLQTQYDYLSSRATSQNVSSRNSEVQLEDAFNKIRELKRVLQDLRDEKEVSDAKAANVANLQEHVADLLAKNRSLEDKITRLCEAPFISDAFGQHEACLRQEELFKERENLVAQVEHLQEAVRTHFSALNSLKQQAAQLRQEKEASDRKAEEYRLKLQELEQGNNLDQEQLKLFSGADEGIDVESLEKALTMVKRRDIALEKLPFLEPVDGDSAGLITIPAMKRNLEELQLLNLHLTEENEKRENMLKIQSTINKDLHKELDALVYSRDREKGEMQRKTADFEQLALRRLDKIHSLEAQLRQLIYGVSKHTKGQEVKGAPLSVEGREGKGDILEGDDEGDDALLQDLLQDAQGEDIRPDANLLEVWIKSATIKDGVLTPGSSTFVVIDFFDYESQTTSVLSGVNPQWDFAASYKITVDDFLLRFFATDVVTLEFNMASQGDFILLGRCSIPLAPLLKSKPRVRLDNHPIISVRTGQIIAKMSMVMRLALPISELYRLFLERHPNEKKYIEELAGKRLLEHSSKAKGIGAINSDLTIANNYNSNLSELNQERMYNELVVVIHRVEGLLVTSLDKAPTPYVHFQLMGHPDKFTSPHFHTTQPLFNEKFTFPMMATDWNLRLIARSKVKFSVIDMEKDDEQDLKRSYSSNQPSSDGFLGEVEVSLAALQEGLPISHRFALKDRNGKPAGAGIFLTMRWRYPLQKQREIGINGLSGIDTEILISAFGPNQSQEDVVDYYAFCKFISPSKTVQDHLTILRLFFISLLEREGKIIEELLTFMFALDSQTISTSTATATNTITTTSSRQIPSNVPLIDRDTFVKVLLKAQIQQLSPKDLEVVFDFIDVSEEGSLSLEKITSILHLDESSGISLALSQKLRNRAQELQSRGVQPVKFFQAVDQWGANGFITRGEFKACLKKMGFTLIDEADIRHHAGTNQPREDSLMEDQEGDMAFDHGDELLLDQHETEGKLSVRRNSKAIRIYPLRATEPKGRK